MKQLSKAMRSILSPSIAMKNEASVWTALLPCGLKCRGDQLGTIFLDTLYATILRENKSKITQVYK